MQRMSLPRSDVESQADALPRGWALDTPRSVLTPASPAPSGRSARTGLGSSTAGPRRFSVYDQDDSPSLNQRVAAEAAVEVSFPEGATTVVRPYQTNFTAKALILLSLVLGPFYLVFIWRHRRADMPIFALLFLLGEAATYVLNMGNRFVLWHRQHRYVCRLDALKPEFPRKHWPKVHIFFTHYMEPVAESVKPLKRALRQQYPPESFVVTLLDDGYHKRKGEFYETTDSGREMEEMILGVMARLTSDRHGRVAKTRRTVLPGHRSGDRSEVAPGGSTLVEFRAEGLPLVRLVGRMKGPDSFLKTGNLENALWNIMEEDVRFMVILDTDMAPEKDMLQLLLPPMLEHREGRWQPDWRTGFVVSPQACTNVESIFGTDDPMNQANKYNWRIAPPALDKLGMVHFWGTNTAFFVPALKDSNGFMYGCIGEDTVTGAALHRFGWKSLFVGTAGVTLARGLCRATVTETFDQRKRWVQGNMQQLLKDLNPPLLLHKGFRTPLYHTEYLEKLQATRTLDRKGELPGPIAPDDCGGAARRARRSLRWRLAKELAYFGPKYSLLFNFIPLYYYGVAMVVVLTGEVPFSLTSTPLRTFRDFLDGVVVIIAYWTATALVAVAVHAYILSDANNPSNTLWRTQQEFWGYAWVRILGAFEGLVSAVTGRQPKWNAFGMAGGVSLLQELPNALAFLAMLVSMCVVLANYCLASPGSALDSLPTPATTPLVKMVASMVVGFWVLFLLWPVTSCIFADFLGIPYYSLGNLVNTFIAGVAQIGFAALWALTALRQAS
uniref:Uncharacterized protein n=2 Tax=Alexandrium monilatum TaxID=311494 RepID=A0A7S4WA67_9DINO